MTLLEIQMARKIEIEMGVDKEYGTVPVHTDLYRTVLVQCTVTHTIFFSLA